MLGRARPSGDPSGSALPAAERRPGPDAEPSAADASPAASPDRRPRFLEGLALLLLFQLAGEVAVRVLDLPIPGNVVGMALLLAALGTGAVPLRWVERAADGLLSVLALLFVPPGVGIVLYLDLLADEWLAIGAVILVGTLAVLAITGWTVEGIERREATGDSGEA